MSSWLCSKHLPDQPSLTQACFSFVMTRQAILSEAGLVETKGRTPLLMVCLNRHRVSCWEPERAMMDPVALSVYLQFCHPLHVLFYIPWGTWGFFTISSFSEEVLLSAYSQHAKLNLSQCHFFKM